MLFIETYTCDYCSENFEDYPSKAKRRKNNFCSRQCHDNFRRYKTIKECVVCGNKWEAVGASTKEYRKKTCSEVCKDELISRTGFQKGQKPHNYKGYRVSTKGYVMLHIPDHKRADSAGYVKRANIVMENKIGRTLKKGEVVHHIDENKQNDDPDNLMLFASDSLHHKYHYMTGTSKINGAPKKEEQKTEAI